MSSLVHYGIVLTLYLYTTTHQYHPTSYSILSILPSHVPTYPFPTQHLTILTYTHYSTPIPITHYIIFIFSPNLIYSPRSYIYSTPITHIPIDFDLPMYPLLRYIIYTPNGASQSTGLIFIYISFYIYLYFFQ